MPLRCGAIDKHKHMLNISYKDGGTNNEALHRVKEDLHFRIWKRGNWCLEGTWWESSEEAHLYILEGKVKGKKNRGRPRLTWMNDRTEDVWKCKKDTGG